MSSGLFEAAHQGNMSMVQTLIHSGSNPSTVDEDERTPLHWAAANGHSDIVEYLYKIHPSAINQQDDALWTPFMSAISSGHLHTARLLLDKGADPNLENETGQIPLHYHKGRKDVVEFLLDVTNNINMQDNIGTTPLSRAITGSPSMGLLKSTIYWYYYYHPTIAWFVCLEIVYMLLDHGAKLNTKDINGNTPLHLSLEEKNEEMALCLVEHGADIHAINKDKISCLELSPPNLRERLEDAYKKFKSAKR